MGPGEAGLTWDECWHQLQAVYCTLDILARHSFLINLNHCETNNVWKLHLSKSQQVTTHATLSSLRNACNMVSGSEQRKGLTLGDCFSKKESLRILSSACENSDAPVISLKEGVEHLYTGPGMIGASARHRQSVAKKLGIKGFSHYDDNIGRVRENIAEISFKIFKSFFQSPSPKLFPSKSTLDSTRAWITPINTFNKQCSLWWSIVSQLLISGGGNITGCAFWVIVKELSCVWNIEILGPLVQYKDTVHLLRMYFNFQY